MVALLVGIPKSRPRIEFIHFYAHKKRRGLVSIKDVKKKTNVRLQDPHRTETHAEKEKAAIHKEGPVEVRRPMIRQYLSC